MDGGNGNGRHQVNVIRDGKLFTVESADIVRGDLIKVEAGELVR